MSNEVTAEHVTEMLREVLPTRTPHFELAFIEAYLKEDDIHAILRLIFWMDEPETGEQSIRDIVEQELLFVPENCRDSRGRVAAFVRAWAGVVTEVLAAHEGRGEDTWILIQELVHPAALQLARAETEEHFARALRAPSRLGGLLGVRP